MSQEPAALSHTVWLHSEPAADQNPSPTQTHRDRVRTALTEEMNDLLINTHYRTWHSKKCLKQTGFISGTEPYKKLTQN